MQAQAGAAQCESLQGLSFRRRPIPLPLTSQADVALGAVEIGVQVTAVQEFCDVQAVFPAPLVAVKTLDETLQ